MRVDDSLIVESLLDEEAHQVSLARDDETAPLDLIVSRFQVFGERRNHVCEHLVKLVTQARIVVVDHVFVPGAHHSNVVKAHGEGLEFFGVKVLGEDVGVTSG